MGGDGKRPGRERPTNDNRLPDGQDVKNETDAAEKLDAVVLSIARLIGRRLAREDYEKATRAANDNAPPEAGDDDR
ncbi:hypothetical protein [Nitratireductor sp. ZSWI3]|uniref:hypothetical protein n=1 Tax=Nitratireductor sp. ZSWI3 TaxID=2966359 RepID=UPI00214FD3F2|nr:hypothetical protein [Nitratireductor sp. ZSWI3]MCR4266428.1 hypothetical protein [Nitratireductor sp. ZSWI3]